MEADKLTRVEVIDATSGRVFVGYFDAPGAELHYQDNDRTLKIFMNGKIKTYD